MRDSGDAGEPDAFECGVGRGGRAPGRSRREAKVLVHGQVVVAKRLVAHERERPANGAPVGGKVDAQHLRVAGAQREQSRAQAEQRGLARAVRTCEQHDLAGIHVEIGARERGEAAEHAYSRPKVHDEQEHGSGNGERDRASLRTTPADRRKEHPPRRYHRWLCDARSRPSAAYW